MNNELLNTSLNQGKKFKKIKEGFTNTNNTNSSSSLKEDLNTLEKQYDILSQDYNTTFNNATKDSLESLSRTSSNNKYANKLVSFNNANGYVTNSGVFKWISSDDIMNSISGVNGCPNKKDIIKINQDATGYNIPGTQIDNLLVGTPMNYYETCGNEGSNVYVSNIANDSKAAYKGCYTDNSSDIQRSDGKYTYEQCKEQSTFNFKRFFGLQNVDPTSSTGTCLLTNDYSISSSGAISNKVSKTIPLWSSNTQGTNGTSASLSLQATLNVFDADGRALFSTPNAQALQSNYIGCYGDNEVRAMEFANNGSYSYDYDTCKQAAIDGKYSLFALQDSTTGTNAQCGLSNDISQSTKYGIANNCTKLSNGQVSGGAWSNALYYASQPTTDYFLIILDNGNMCIYRGASPDQQQDLIWQSSTVAKSADSNYKAVAGKYGRNWIKIGEPLNVGEFVGSLAGTAYLIMQTDGNLVLYTSELTSNCTKMNDGNMGAGEGGIALYELNKMGNSDLVGKLAFITPDSELREYPDSMQEYTNEYTIFNKQNNPGNDISSSQVTDITGCQTMCNNDPNCSGFTYQSSTNTCWTKNKDAFPNKLLTQDDSYTMGLRKKKPISQYCSSKSVNIDSTAYINYKQGHPMDSNTKCNEPIISPENMNKLTNIKTQLNNLGNKIVNQLTTIKTNTSSKQTEIQNNTQKFNNNLNKYNNIQKKIDANNIEGMRTLQYSEMDMNSYVSDTNLYVLQENSSYVFWGILAVGVVLITASKLSKS